MAEGCSPSPCRALGSPSSPLPLVRDRGLVRQRGPDGLVAGCQFADQVAIVSLGLVRFLEGSACGAEQIVDDQLLQLAAQGSWRRMSAGRPAHL